MIPYDLVSKTTGAKVSVSTSTKTIKITKASATSSSSIKTKYQGHTYGADNQYQYDKTMSYVNNYFKSYKNVFHFGGDYTKSYEDYLKNGVSAPPGRPTIDMSDYDYGLKLAENLGKDLRENKVTYNEIAKAYEVASKAQALLNSSVFKDYGSAKDMYSAYLIFYQHKGDCDSVAHVLQTVFDRNGYKTRVASTSAHAWLEVQISGKWYSFEGTFSQT